MYNSTPKEPFKITSAADAHITKVGRFLRKYSIDELPQFLNIIKGDNLIPGLSWLCFYVVLLLVTKRPLFYRYIVEIELPSVHHVLFCIGILMLNIKY